MCSVKPNKTLSKLHNELKTFHAIFSYKSYKNHIIQEIGDWVEIKILELEKVQSFIDDSLMDEEFTVVVSNVDKIG